MDFSWRVMRALLATVLAILLLPAFVAGVAKAEDSSVPVDAVSLVEPSDAVESAPADAVGIAPAAIPAGCSTCHIGDLYGGSGWAGNYYLDGVVGYCVDPHRWYPDRLGNFGNQGNQNHPYGRTMGWITAWYDNPSQDLAIAISMLAALHAGEFGGANNDEQWRMFPHLQGLALQIEALGNSFAGPYWTLAQVHQQPSHENGAGIVAVFDVANEHGYVLGGFKTDWFSIRSATNVTDLVVEQEGNSGRFWVGATVTDTSKPWGIEAGTNENAPGGIDLWTYQGGNPVQDFISKSPGRQLGTPASVAGDALKFMPSIATKTAEVLVDSVQGTLHDHVTIGGAPGMAGMPFTGRTSLYGPFVTNAQAMAADVSSLTPVGYAEFRGTYDQDGNAELISDGVDYEGLGFYFWFEELEETDWVVGVTQQLSGRVTETTLVTQPEIASVISNQRIEHGGTVTDAVKLTGLETLVGDQSVEWTLTGGLYGPIPPGEDNQCVNADWASAMLVDPITRVVNASEIQVDGSVSLADVGVGVARAADGARCVSYGWTLSGVAPDGTKVVTTHAPGDPDQTGVITFHPQITTMAQAQVISAQDIPLEIRDRVVVFDGIAGRSFEGRTALYGPFVSNDHALTFEAPELDDDGNEILVEDESSMLIGVASFTGAFDENGRAEFLSDPVIVSEFGYYLWIEELFERPDGGEPVEPSKPEKPCKPIEPGEPEEQPSEPCGPNSPDHKPRRPSETLIMIDATIATQVSDQSVERGSTITDTVKATGLVTRVGDSVITWSMDIQLFGPNEPNQAGTCENLDWADVEMIESTTIEITEDMIDEDGNLLLKDVGEYLVPLHGERGCLTYGETLTGIGPDGSIVKFVHEPGDPSQTTLVLLPQKPPTTGALGSGGSLSGMLLSIMLLVTGLGVGIIGLRKSS